MSVTISNPLIRLEFMRRFRGRGAAWGIPLLAVLPGAAVTIAYAAVTASNSFEQEMMQQQGFGAPAGGSGNVVTPDQLSFGAPMFIAIMATLLFVLMVLIPAVVGGSISSERANLTLQPLQLTALTPTQIVMGKLASSLAYIVLLLVCLAPAIAVTYLAGGIGLSEILRTYLILILVCVEIAAVALAMSALISKPVGSIVVALLAVGVVVIAPFVVTGIGFWVQADPLQPQDPSESVMRFLSTASPVSLFSWVNDFGSNNDRFIERGIERGFDDVFRWLSVTWWIVTTSLALLLARHRVTAPIEKDR